ncbi:MAG TPA: hypothetical protein VHF67_07500 [Gaiellaceae bacterium]|jgi:hypothetical protein|nr:hypothetical protein [Gaiellaceae bacterium]
MDADGAKVLVLAARQPDFVARLEHDGFAVDVRTRPLDDASETDADLAVVFRGRLIGRGQAAALAGRGIPVVEVLTVEPPGTSSAGWIRLSNRISKTDLVQVVHAMADGARPREDAPVAAR